MTRRMIAGAILTVALALGCGEDPQAPANGGGPASGDQVPDFSLPDVNATSPTFDTAVSPRDYLQAVSGWYFGHAT